MGKVKLSKERYKELIDAERKLNELLPEYDHLEECGYDCTQLRMINQQRGEQIQAMKKYYAPGA